jgi:putative hemin transport protein
MFEMIDIPLTRPHTHEWHKQAALVSARYAVLDEGLKKSLRARDLSQQLGISEAQWVASGCGPIKSQQLKGTGQSVFKELSQLGEVMALTRNDSCVHERYGLYRHIQAEAPIGLVLGPDIDLRAFFSCWQTVFAVQEKGRQSIQFFDRAGNAIHKVYCTEKTDMAAYLSLVQRNAIEPVWPLHTPIIPKMRSDNTTDPDAFRAAWLAMTDTHDFLSLLKKFEISRIGALRLAGADLAQPVSVASIRTMLDQVALTGLAIMCFVGNHGMIQIHTGSVKNIATRGSWLNVLDPLFNLHLNLDRVSQVWVVNKPTSDGWVTSLEVFDDKDDMIVQFFGARKPGQIELSNWRHQMTQLCKHPLRF